MIMKTGAKSYNLISSIFAVSALALTLSGCSGGGSSGGNTAAANTLGGVAATGSPIVNGSIMAICASGSKLSTTSDSSGAWQTTLSGQTLPCAVQVTGGTVSGAPNTTLYHSVAIATGTVNISPLTDLMVANLAGTATPGTWFDGLKTTPAPLNLITQTTVDATLVKLRAALNGLIPLHSINPLTTPFTPTAGNTSDDMLSALKNGMAGSGTTHSALLGYASVPAFTVSVTGFDSALAAAYIGTASGGTPATPGMANFAGTYNLTTSTGTVATIAIDATGNVTSCLVGTIVSCSGTLTLNSASNTASFQISGNDGLNPVDTTATVSGTIDASGAVTGSYSGNSISGGAFNGTLTGTQALQYITIPGYANAAAQAGDALPGLIQIQRTSADPCVTPPATPTGLTVNKRQGSYLFNDMFWSLVRPGKYPDWIRYEVRMSTTSNIISTDAIGCSTYYVNGCSDVDQGALGYTPYTYFSVQAINSCGLRSAFSGSYYSPSAIAAPAVSGLNPSSGPVGTVVTISGTNFSATAANNTVKFNGTPATVTAATATSITVTVPSGATTGTISVTTAGGTATSATSFTVSAGGTTTSTLTLSGSVNHTLTMSQDATQDINTTYPSPSPYSQYYTMYDGTSTASAIVTAGSNSRTNSGTDEINGNYLIYLNAYIDPSNNIILSVNGGYGGGTEIYYVGTNLAYPVDTLSPYR